MIWRNMREGAAGDARALGRFARDVPRRGALARETVTQALKAGLAAVLAWTVGVGLLGLPQPYLAAWVAMVMVRPTVHWSVLTGVRQVASVVLGVGVAVAAVVLMPGKVLALAVAVPVAFLIGCWPRLGDQGLYVPFTALLMVAVDSVAENYVLLRLLETGLGAVLGMAVNLLVFPPLRIQAVDDRVRRDGAATAGVLRDLAAGLRGDGTGTETWDELAERLDDRSAQTLEAVRHAREGLRLNPRRVHAAYQHTVDRSAEAFDLTRGVARPVRSIVDVLTGPNRDGVSHGSLDPAFNARYAAVLDAAADLYERRLEALMSPDGALVADGGLADELDALERWADPRAAKGTATAEVQGALLAALRRLVDLVAP
jgi:uncharacterized membrane protein YgaE (UPF0421/DUF939 family)